eukprot:c30035_g1_i1 orf=240-413(+)
MKCAQDDIRWPANQRILEKSNYRSEVAVCQGYLTFLILQRLAEHPPPKIKVYTPIKR